MESDTNKISLSLKDNEKLAGDLAGASAGDTVKIGDGLSFIIDEISVDLVVGSIDTDDIGDVTVESSGEDDNAEQGYDNPDDATAAAPVVSVMGGR